jgi:heat shock protein HslJ
LVAGSLFVNACVHRLAPPAPTPTLEQIRHATFSGILEQAIALDDGVYEGAPLVEGASSQPRVLLWEELSAFGDLDGRPGEEAAVLLSESSAGSGERVHLAVVAVREGGAVNVATALVGDRTRVRTMAITGGAIAMDVVEAGTKDAACCPTRLAQKRYALSGDRLAMVSSEDQGTLSIDAVGGEPWTLVAMDGTVPPPGCNVPTIKFDGRRLSSFGGCSTYTGTVDEIGPGEITVSTLAGTRRACRPDAMNLDQEYSTRLERVRRYTFLAGQLALSGDARGAPFLMVFERPPEKKPESPL